MGSWEDREGPGLPVRPGAGPVVRGKLNQVWGVTRVARDREDEGTRRSAQASLPPFWRRLQIAPIAPRCPAGDVLRRSDFAKGAELHPREAICL